MTNTIRVNNDTKFKKPIIIIEGKPPQEIYRKLAVRDCRMCGAIITYKINYLSNLNNSLDATGKKPTPATTNPMENSNS